MIQNHLSTILRRVEVKMEIACSCAYLRFNKLQKNLHK